MMTSWQLLPDIPSAAFFTLGVALLLIGIRRAGAAATERVLPAAGWLVAAGLCFGWAYLIRETIPFLFPLIAFVLWAWRVAWSRWLVVAGTMAATFVAELFVNWGLYGDALARFTAGAEQGGRPARPLRRLDVADQFLHIVHQYRASLLWAALLLASVVGAVVWRRRDHVLPAVWVALYWLAMFALGGGLNPDHLILRSQLPRYWIPMLPALVIGAAGFAAAAWRRVARGRPARPGRSRRRPFSPRRSSPGAPCPCRTTS